MTMIFKAPQMGVGSRVRYTFLDPETDERIPAINAETGEEVWGGEWHNNMITDHGLDAFAVYSPRDGSDALGSQIQGRLTLSGDMPEIKEPSGAIEASQSGNTITASGAFFSPADVGRAIVFADGNSARITSYVSGTAVQVDVSQVVPPQAFERWHVDISSVPSPLDAGTSNGGANRAIGYSSDGNFLTVTINQTRVVTLADNRNVSGVGLGYPGNNSAYIIECIRDGSGNPITVSMLAGKQVRVDSSLVVRLPRASKYVMFQIDEYDAANQLVGTTGIDADFWVNTPSLSAPVLSSAFDVFWPNAVGISEFFGGLNSSALSLTPGIVQQITTSMLISSPGSGYQKHLGAYVPGSRRRTKEVTIPAAAQVGALHGLAGTNLANASMPAILFRNSVAFTKADTHTLRAGWEVSWDRDYSVS